MRHFEGGNLKQIIADEIDSIIDLRRHLHQNPELAFNEFKTAETLQNALRDIPDLSIKTGIANTGFFATLGADKKGKCIAFRADMDALPIQETSRLPYASEKEGIMHACGHDGHSAILVGLAKVLSKCKDQLKGPVKFVFQPAEEGGGGAKHMVQSGVLDSPKVDAMFGLHGWPSIDLGKIGALAGPFFASTNIFDIKINGARGHAAFPHHTIDPMPVAASIIQALQTLVSRSTDPLDSCVLSICEIKGGSTYNVISNEIIMKGTLRCFSQEHREATLLKIAQMSESIATGFGATATVTIKDVGYPVLVNDTEMVDLCKSTVTTIYDKSAIEDIKPTMGGEDFAYYAQKVPSCLWLLGVKDPAVSDWPQLHTSNYDFNDDALRIGIRIQSEIALQFQSYQNT